MYDAAIIGTGPAGLSAALNLKIHQKSFIWIGAKNLSDKVEKAEQILNYPGLSDVSGKELMHAYQKQIKDMGIEIIEAMVNSIMPLSGHYAVMAGSEFYEAQAIILATGMINVASMKGEADFIGKGLSYCATCDGMLYRNRTIGIACNNKRFEHEIKYLAEIAKKVYLFPAYKECSIDLANVEKVSGIEEICGEKRVSSIKLKNGEAIEVDGVFVLRNAIAMTTLLQGLMIEDNYIQVNRKMETNMRGCFAAGDCTGRPYQYTKAVGEGNVAAHTLLEYLASLEKAIK